MKRKNLFFSLAEPFSTSGYTCSTNELVRNPGDYLPSKAQARYQRRRKKCREHKLLENPELFALVKKLFLEHHWSPEQIAARLKLENYPIQISYKTIYRAIYAAMFDTPEQKRSTGNRGAIRKLRHRGKPRRKRGKVTNRGKIPISNELEERPSEANERSRRGDFEADTLLGKIGEVALLTLVDRKSRFLFVGKLSKLDDKHFPKGYDFDNLMEKDLRAVVDQLNHRPRKCLGYRRQCQADCVSRES